MIPIRLLTVLGLAGIVTAFPQMTTEPPSPPTAEPTPIEACSTRTICRDFINECGQMYGGCHNVCRPWPTFTKPPCKPNGSTN
ncbi:hypothetical protein LZ32DRAFT_601593 [Colletotrichum eremochloae]|nr:hypothetical protein LZ32DRAFT_601593 [Colletotrichum eremochloae]